MSGVFEGRCILVVGASSGIGAELTRQLLDQGAEVIAWGRQHPEQTGWGSKVQFAPWDVMSGTEAPTSSLPEKLHGLVYLPGSIPLKPFHRTSPDDFRQTLEINFLGAVRAIQAALPALKGSGDASVVLMSTVASRIGMPFHSAIASAKAAIEGLTLSLASEYAAQGLRFNAVAPSLTRTPLAQNLLSTPEKAEASARRHPLGRVGEAGDPAALVRFLLSPEAGWMTGQVVGVDGGLGNLKAL
ncbi:MAG: SDR family NAD(P)-dependent oxidoreductase [Bacteroidota bacterium]